jgi:hypothetical protein
MTRFCAWSDGRIDKYEPPYFEPGYQPNGPFVNALEPAALRFPLIAFKDVTFDLDEECRIEGIFPLVGLACIFGSDAILVQS